MKASSFLTEHTRGQLIVPLRLHAASGENLPGFEAVEGVLHPLLVVFDHVGVHLRIVAPNVALSAAVWDGPEAEWGVLLLRLLKLLKVKQKILM